MAPGSPARFATALDRRIVIELIIPNNIENGVVIDFLECRPDRILCRVTNAVLALLERWSFAACEYILLAKGIVFLRFAAKWASLGCRVPATGKGGRIEFEYEPPVHFVALCYRGGWRISRI